MQIHLDRAIILQPLKYNKNQKKISLNRLSKEAVLGFTTMPEKDELQFLIKQPAIKQQIKETNQKLIELMSDLSILVMGKETIPRSSLTLPFKKIEDTLDLLLENAGIQIDRHLKKEDDEGFQTVAARAKKHTIEDQIKIDFQNKPKFAYKFDRLIDFNLNNEHPFVPILKTKPYAQKPLDEGILKAQHNKDQYFTQDERDWSQFDFQHPYLSEIQNLDYSEKMLSPKEDINKFTEMQPPIYVDTEEKLKQLVQEVLAMGETEIALDLEHHHQRSYLGLTCLIQLSTRDNKDYIIDPFPLWGVLGDHLNLILHNPKIVKVLHGSDSDVLWLQRDFGLYLVNLFDTFHASKTLQLAQQSLSHLLSEYCRKFTDKKYQLADWTHRPLSTEMLKYAQMDTHFLLYIYDRLKIDLYNLGIQKNIQPFNSYIVGVFQKSSETSLKVFRKPLSLYSADQSLDWILLKSQQTMDKRRYELTIKVMEWRERLGRQLDENPRHFLPNHSMFKLVDLKPKKRMEVYSALGGERNTSHIVKIHIEELLQLFNEVKQEPQQGEQKVYTVQQEIKKMKIEEPVEPLERLTIYPIKVQIARYTGQNKGLQLTSGGQFKQKDFECNFKNSFELLSLFNPELGGLLQSQLAKMDNFNKSEAQLKQEEMLKPTQAETSEFMAFPKITQEDLGLPRQNDSSKKQIRLFDEDSKVTSLQDTYGTKLKKRREQRDTNWRKQNEQKNPQYNVFQELKK